MADVFILQEERTRLWRTVASVGYRGWSGDLYQSVNNTHNAHTPADCVPYTLNPRRLDTPLQLGRNFKGNDLHKYLISCARKKIFNLEISAVDPDPYP